MVHRYAILPEKRLILQYFSEHVSLEDLILALNYVVTDPLYDPRYDGLTVLTDAEVGLSASSVKHFSKWFEEVVKGSSELGRLALMVDRPSHTALSQIFQFELTGFQNINVFNTCEGACGWLELEGTQMYDEIQKLRKKSPSVMK